MKPMICLWRKELGIMSETPADLQRSVVSFRPSQVAQGVAPDLPTQPGHLGLGLVERFLQADLLSGPRLPLLGEQRS